MEDLTLTYFDYPGHAEAIRLALRIGKIPFEDVRLHPTEAENVQLHLSYGSLPTLTVNGEIHSQSSAILRYVGKKTGLYPQNELVALRVDEVIDTILQFFHGLEAIEKKDAEHCFDDVKKYHIESVPRYLGGLESRLREFGNGPWAVGESITIADLAIYVCMLYVQAGAFQQLTPAKVIDFKRLQDSAEAVREHPQVLEWNEYIEGRAAEVKERKAQQKNLT
ncbi:unnamed protein product [Agarophyton chilense]